MANRTYHPRGELVDGYAPQDHPLYVTWAGMLGRCCSSKFVGYEYYGGRGISVCDRWVHFRYFAEDMGLKPSPDLTLERIDNSKGYSPVNCRWETRSNQCVNRRTFQNNTSGHTGVIDDGGSWIARFEYEGQRYNIGWFASFDEAVHAREAFVELFFSDRDLAMEMLPKDKARHTSSTQVRGVTPHRDGGFTVRITLNGQRYYLGYFQSFDDACAARTRFLTERDNGSEVTQRDTSKARRTSQTGVKGINPSKGGFVVRVEVNGKRTYVGKFRTLEEAINAIQDFVTKQAQ